jgi:hypothetical protein
MKPLHEEDSSIRRNKEMRDRKKEREGKRKESRGKRGKR